MITSLLLTSCGKGKSIQAIPIEDVEDTYFLDEIADSRSYVLLDDSSLDAIVGDITQVMVDDELIFVSHVPNAKGNDIDQIISVYDKDGRFLNKIGQKGRARNEFLRIQSWCIDKDSKEVLMYDLDAYAIKICYVVDHIKSLILNRTTSVHQKELIRDVGADDSDVGGDGEAAA